MNLDQTCPDCGTTEAAGSYCTLCLRPTTDVDKHPAKRSDAQTDALRRSTAARQKESPRGASEAA